METGMRETTLKAGTKLTVFSIRKTRNGGTIWVRAGNGFVNKDSSVNLYLDVLPLDGTLHAREQVVERRDSVAVPAGTPANVAADLANAQVEGHS
jgi:hypothetical protein